MGNGDGDESLEDVYICQCVYVCVCVLVQIFCLHLFTTLFIGRAAGSRAESGG